MRYSSTEHMAEPPMPPGIEPFAVPASSLASVRSILERVLPPADAPPERAVITARQLDPVVLRRMLRVLCDDMRADGLFAEHVLLALKSAWRSMPEALALPPVAQRDLLDYLITLALDEFYHGAR